MRFDSRRFFTAVLTKTALILFSLGLTLAHQTAIAAGDSLGLLDTNTLTNSDKTEQVFDFTLPTSTTKNLRLAELRGQPLLIQFTANWCSECESRIQELLTTLANNPEHRLLVIELAANRATAAPIARAIQQRIEQQSLSQQIDWLYDNEGHVGERYGIDELPVTLVLNHDGIPAERANKESTLETLIQHYEELQRAYPKL